MENGERTSVYVMKYIFDNEELKTEDHLDFNLLNISLTRFIYMITRRLTLGYKWKRNNYYLELVLDHTQKIIDFIIENKKLHQFSYQRFLFFN